MELENNVKTIEMETIIDSDGKLPEAFQEVFGRKARVIVLYQEENQLNTCENNTARLMELAGKINSFKEIDDPVSFQRKMRNEWM